MKYYFGFTFLTLLAIWFLVGCQCDHDWTNASCIEKKKCMKCGKMQGELLDHVESEWENNENTLNIENLTMETYRSCIVCDEILETKTITLNSLHDDKYFVFSPVEYTNRLSFILNSLNYSELSTECVINKTNNQCTCIIYDNSDYPEISFFMNNNSFISGQRDKGISEIHTYLYDRNYENCVSVITAILLTCDPNLTQENVADHIALIPKYNLFGNNYESGDPYYYNGIGYKLLKLDAGSYRLVISVLK